KKSLSALGLASSNAPLLPEGTVVVALRGHDPNRGKSAILRREMSCHSSLAGIVPERTKIEPDYLFHYLDAQEVPLRRLAEHAGLSLAELRDYEILVPTLDVQKKIAEILNCADEAIDAAR